MIDLLLGQFLPYIVGALGLAFAFIGVKSKVQSSKIEKQDEAIKIHQVNEVALNQAVEAQKETIKQVEKVNEIYNNPVKFDDAVARLRAGAKSRSNDRKSKL